jgi:uncharacterized membrane protein
MSDSSTSLNRRIATVDLVRGMLMIIMALDHTRDFFSSATVDATDPLQSWPALFFTRWITHLCAPGFVALAGTSIYLQRQRGRSGTDMAKKLVTRGLWLICVEVLIVSFGIFFTYHFHFLQVIYAIGGSMIILAALQFLPTRFVALYGFAIVFLHNLLDRIPPPHPGLASDAWKFLIMPGAFIDHSRLWILDTYPILPWSGIMALGYAFGAIVLLPPAKRRVRSMQLGLAALALFITLRLTGLYGDPIIFKPLGTFTRTVMAFFQVTKYPPSLQYVCATLGILLVIFSIADRALERHIASRPLGVVEVYGRVPFFYYIPHFYILHLLMVATAMITMHSIHIHLWKPVFDQPPPTWGYGLPIVYGIWIAVVAVLYFPCKWFAGIKARRRDWWLSYL